MTYDVSSGTLSLYSVTQRKSKDVMICSKDGTWPYITDAAVTHILRNWEEHCTLYFSSALIRN